MMKVEVLAFTEYGYSGTLNVPAISGCNLSKVENYPKVNLVWEPEGPSN